MRTADAGCATVIPPDEYIAVDHRHADYGGDAVSVESLTDVHGPEALPSYLAWWKDNREGRSVPTLPDGIGGIFVEDYLDWVEAAAPLWVDDTPACRWCRDTGTVTLATSTQPCLDCAAGKGDS